MTESRGEAESLARELPAGVPLLAVMDGTEEHVFAWREARGPREDMDMKEMTDILRWLRGVEELASLAYREAAERFASDAELSAFLGQLAEDERLHYHLIGSARELFSDSGKFPRNDIAVDRATRERTEELLQGIREEAQHPAASKARVFDCIARMEFSEWNDVFLYAMRTCQQYSKTFHGIAAEIQAHRDRVASYIEALPEDVRPSGHLARLQDVWRRRFLVVDDSPVLRGLLCDVLTRDNEVLAACDGQEALALLQRSYFDVVISDIEMPVMDGYELFRRGREMDASLPERFIFCSGVAEEEVEAFCRDSGTRYVLKPINLSQLWQTVQEMLTKTKETS